MKSMFSRLFCSVMFIAAVLGNVVMAKNDNIDDTVYSFLNHFAKCEVYSDECLAGLNEERGEDIMNNVLGEYDAMYHGRPKHQHWFYTVAKFMQEVKIKNHAYNKKMNASDPKSKIDRYNEFRMYADGSAYNSDLCTNLILGYMNQRTPIMEYLSGDYIPKAKAHEIMLNTFGLSRVCDYNYGADGNIYFDIKWDSKEFKRMVDYTIELIDNMEGWE